MYDTFNTHHTIISNIIIEKEEFNGKSVNKIYLLIEITLNNYLSI